MWTLIFAMAAIIFISRYVFIEPKLPIRLNTKAQHFLSYAAPAVMTAIFAPLVFVTEGDLNISIANSYLVAAVAATILAIVTRNTLATTVISMGLFFVIH